MMTLTVLGSPNCAPCRVVKNLLSSVVLPADTINDIDRVLCLLQGHRHVERDLEARINAALYEGEPYADGRIRVTGYKNGNLHLEFRDQSLLDGINRIIAEHYGVALGRDAA